MKSLFFAVSAFLFCCLGVAVFYTVQVDWWIKSEAKDPRETMAKHLCQPGASHEWIGDDLWCTPKRGKTYKAQLQQ